MLTLGSLTRSPPYWRHRSCSSTAYVKVEETKHVSMYIMFSMYTCKLCFSCIPCFMYTMFHVYHDSCIHAFKYIMFFHVYYIFPCMTCFFHAYYVFHEYHVLSCILCFHVYHVFHARHDLWKPCFLWSESNLHETSMQLVKKTVVLHEQITKFSCLSYNHVYSKPCFLVSQNKYK